MMKKVQLLLIEPDYLLGKIYKDHLEKFNYAVRICSDVQFAIDQIDVLKPDVIILELQLSAHNGYEFLYELRSYSEWQDIPVLIHTMVPEEALELNPIAKLELNIIDYLYKPSTSLAKLHYELNRRFLVAKV
jgi:DNA-binding response OmpR family regulator